jgi:hypothetical protein
MGMSIRKSEKESRKQKSEPKQRMLPYKLASYEHDHEGKKIRSSKVVYSFWSASKYVLILSLMLWWLPMFGQMIAGYVGGRRAGGPWKGVAAAVVPVVSLYAIATGFSSGLLPSHAFGVAIAPSLIGASLTHSIPFVSPYLHFSSEYVGSFVKMLEGSSPYGINVYVITVAFAYVGGILAEQSRREIEYTAGSVTSNTTVLVHDPRMVMQQPAVEYAQPAHSVGILASLGGLFHRSEGDSEDVAAAYMPRRRTRRDPWAGASDMRYYADEPEEDEGYMLPSVEPYRMPDDYGGYQYRPSKRAMKREAWRQAQKRRGRPNMSSKPRFRYDQYGDQPRQAPKQHNNYSNNNAWRRPKRNQNSYKISSGDPRSIRRANKMIDDEWGGKRKYRTYSEMADEETMVEERPEPVQNHHKEHGSNHNWDSI